MRKFTFVLSFAISTAILLGHAEAQSVRDRLAKDVVVATVDGQQILSSEMIRAFQSLRPQVRQRGLRAVYNQLLEQLIEDRLLTIHGRLNNLADDPEVKVAVKKAEDRIIGQVYINRLIAQTITEESLRTRYDELAKNTPSQPEVRASHILVGSKAEADEVLKMLAGGQPFAEVAKTHSKDESGPRGGELGYFRAGDMVKPFSDAAFAMKPGETSKAPVKTEFGWHIIQVADKRDSTPPPFERVRPQIIRDLSRRIAADVLNQARAGAKIERFTLDGQPLPPPTAPQPKKK